MTEKDYARYCAIEARLENDDEMKALKHRLEIASADLGRDPATHCRTGLL